MKIGDKVVCVDDSPSKCNCCWGMSCPLTFGSVYVVSRAGRTQTGHPYIEVVGVRLSHHRVVFGFAASRFRLLSEMKNERRTVQTLRAR